MNDSQPDWFKEALSISKEEKSIIVEGKSIHYQQWGDKDKQGLVLVHGSGSHSHWWDFIAPLLLDNFQVSALDMSGMGIVNEGRTTLLNYMEKKYCKWQKIVVSFKTTNNLLFVGIAWADL